MLTQAADHDPVPLAECLTGWLELSGERDRYLDRILQAELAGYGRGHADGYNAGYLAAVAEHKAVQRDLQRSWRELSDLAKRRRLPARRPGDYPGGAA